MVRNIREVYVYFESRLPECPMWLTNAIAEVLLRHPSWRLLEKTDVEGGLEIQVVEFRETDQTEKSGLSSWLAEENPIQERDGKEFLFWVNHTREQCGGPIDDLLLLGLQWPETCTEMPPTVMFVEGADLNIPLVEQLPDYVEDVST